MEDNKFHYDWSDLAFKSKRPLSQLGATFIAAPRDISVKRFRTLLKEYLTKGPIVLGIAKEDYVIGFEGQPQFTTLKKAKVQTDVDKVNRQFDNKIIVLEYSQRELTYILDKIDFKQAVFINGSWKYTFHTQPPFYTLVKKRLPYTLVSPFVDEQEAKDYAASIEKLYSKGEIRTSQTYSAQEMLQIAQMAGERSFDYSFQTGVSLGRSTKGGRYEFITSAFNKVVPYQTYAMHFGASREKHFSPLNDLNHYDTVHAEVELMLRAAANLEGATLFINLLPCPPCSRMLSETSLTELVYSEDHSAGYAVQLLEASGIKVRRIVAETEKTA